VQAGAAAQAGTWNSAVIWTVVAASFGFTLVQLDVTIVNVALPAIATALQAEVADLQWVIDAYALCFAAFLLGAGFLGDRLGARRIYLTGMAIFAAASLACGLAPDTGFLIAARAVQGLGAAAMLPCSLSLINHATGHDAALRARAIGWWTASGSIAIATAPLVGGLLLGITTWRAIFLVNLPICLLGAALTLKIQDTPAQKSADDGKARDFNPRSFDPWGQILVVIALAGLTGAVIETKPLGLLHPAVLAAAIIGVLAAIAFVSVEARSIAPLLPLHFFRRAEFSIAVLYGIIVNLTYYGAIFVLSLYLQRVLHYSAIETGLAYLPLTAGFFAVNLLSGWWVGKAGSRPPMMVGALVDALGFLLLCLLGAQSPYWLMLPAFLLMPGGMGLGVPAMTAAIMGSVEKSASGVAAAVSTATRQAGGAIGVALFGALAGKDPAHMVAGLHLAAMIAVGLLLVAAVLTWFGLRGASATRSARQPTGRPAPQPARQAD
jgi:DHA2 family methylenomycin A resistance protein-like MFS transporter